MKAGVGGTLSSLMESLYDAVLATATDHKPCLYFVADAMRYSKGLVKMFTAFSWVLILFNYVHLIKLCFLAA